MSVLPCVPLPRSLDTISCANPAPVFSDPHWRAPETGRAQARRLAYRVRRAEMRKPKPVPCPEHGTGAVALLRGNRICWTCWVDAHAALVVEREP